MACDGEEHRYQEFVSWLREGFRAMDPQKRAYIIAEIEGRIGGFARLWHSPHIEEWVLDGLVVRPSHRGAGVGYSLLLHALDRAARWGARSVVAHVRKDNVPAIRIHEKAGFQPEARTYRNSYGEERRGNGGQYRVQLPLKNANPRCGTR